MIPTPRKCRTCLECTKGLQYLTKLAVGEKDDDSNQGKSYADLLKEVVLINIEENKGDLWPFYICSCCSRKLKAAYEYIQQARHINAVLKAKLLQYNGEHEIDTEYLEVKMEAVENYHIEEEEDEQMDIKTENNLEDNCLKVAKAIPLSKADKNELCDNTYINLIETQQMLEDTKETVQELKGKRKKRKSKRSTKTKANNLKTKDTANEEKAKDATDTPMKCMNCEKLFENARQLNRHQLSAHVPEELQVQCLQCEAKFARRHNMLAHMRLFHKVDNLEELETATAEAHATTISTPKKRFLCTLCGLTFNSRYCLNIHFRRHTGEKPYKCEYCDRAYIRLCDVQVHRRSHTGEKPYKCSHCEKAFSRANRLKIHIRSHTNERPYKCTQCDKAFKQSKHLNEHMRTHTGERPYSCGVCQSTFTQSNSLRSHQVKQNHLKEASGGEDLASQLDIGCSKEELKISVQKD